MRSRGWWARGEWRWTRDEGPRLGRRVSQLRQWLRRYQAAKNAETIGLNRRTRCPGCGFNAVKAPYVSAVPPPDCVVTPDGHWCRRWLYSDA